MRRSTLPVLAAALVGGLLTALPADAATISARSLLSELTVASEGGAASYSRTAFKHWIDADGDSCDAREEVLLAESRVKARRGAGCTVIAGRWVSPYDGRTWTHPSAVDIDHLVPLKEAWDSGARTWSAAARTAFANDLSYAATLVAVTDNVNASKGDRDPAEWLPGKARCRYATQWVAVKYRWQLAVDRREKRELSSLLRGACGARRLSLPARASVGTTPVPAPTTVTSPAATPTAQPTATYPPEPTPTYSGVTPGAFCGDHYAYGHTSAGTLMQCKPSATDSRFRWRAA